jgi:hypothetical protein
MTLKELLKRLLGAGAATAAEKAEVKSLFGKLKEAEQEEVKEDVEAVDALPEDDEATDEKALGDLIERVLNDKIDTRLEKGVDSVLAKNRAKALGEEAKKLFVFDKDAYAAFAKNVVAGKKADFSFDIKGIDPSNTAHVAKALELVMKEVGPIGVDGNVTGEWPQAELEPGVTRAPQREPFIEELVTVGRISSNLDAWIETTDGEGNPAPVAELALIPQKDYDFVRRTAPVQKIGVHSKHSAELAEDLPSLVSEIRNYLVADLRKVVDVQLLSGDGEGENLTGILENATPFAAGALAGSVDEANRFDVIEAAVTQVIVGLHQPTHVTVNPIDRAKMRLSKASDGHYVLPPFIASDGSVISGVRVVANTGIAAGKFLVGDFKKASVKYKRGLTVEMSNSDGDDFVKDRFTMKATVRLVQRVKQNDYGAFVYGDFDTAITALEQGS